MPDMLLPNFGPVEDLLLNILRDYFSGTDITVASVFREGMTLPAIVARQDKKSGTSNIYASDPRFFRVALVSVDVVCEGPDADQDASLLHEAVKDALVNAWFSQLIVEGVGYIAKIENIGTPSRSADWATSTGVVQYASLPQGAVRFDNTFRLFIRPDQDQTRAREFNPFLRQSYI